MSKSNINGNRIQIMPEYVFFWKVDEENGCFSNWYDSPFTVEGVQYWCVEQYMMAHKALAFHDLQIYEQIMRSHNPQGIKNLGRQVRNFDSRAWSACKEEIVYNGCFAKFSQNNDLRNKLMSTSGKLLAEASPRDKIWGIGLDAATAQRIDCADWPGQNLLGEILVDVRAILEPIA